VFLVLRFEVGEQARDGADDFVQDAHNALAVLAACAGFVRGQLHRAFEDPGLWCLTVEWESVGAYRRALGSYAVRAGATQLLGRALAEASAYETLAQALPGGAVRAAGSDRSPQADAPRLRSQP
jgi:hypothetical protein